MEEIKRNLSTIWHFAKINESKIILLFSIGWILGISIQYFIKGNYDAGVAVIIWVLYYGDELRKTVKQ